MRGQGDTLQAFRPQQRHVNGRRRHQQALVGADIGSRLGAANVLLPCLQGQGEAGLTFQIHGTADNATWHLAHEVLLAAHEAEIRTARGQRRTQGLTFAHRDVGAMRTPQTGRF